jgi:hypothetical protein
VFPTEKSVSAWWQKQLSGPLYSAESASAEFYFSFRIPHRTASADFFFPHGCAGFVRQKRWKKIPYFIKQKVASSAFFGLTKLALGFSGEKTGFFAPTEFIFPLSYCICIFRRETGLCSYRYAEDHVVCWTCYILGFQRWLWSWNTLNISWHYPFNWQFHAVRNKQIAGIAWW